MVGIGDAPQRIVHGRFHRERSPDQPARRLVCVARGVAMSKRARTLLSITILAAIVGAAPTAVSAEPFVFVGLYPGALQNKISTIQDVDAWIAPTGKRV